MRKLESRLLDVRIEVVTETFVASGKLDGVRDIARFVGANPIFLPTSEEGGFRLTADMLRKAITPKTRAILPVHLGMRFADLDAIMTIAQKRNLKVVEDCAHVHGGMWRGKGAGSIGDLGAFSFQSSKLMTCGEGGAVITPH